MLRVVLLLVCYLALSLAQADNLLVYTDKGPVLGHTTETNKRWLGIPYASPPKGNLRWQPPQPAASWTTVYNATDYGFACPQTNAQTPLPPAWDEDCLNLNVFAPLHAAPYSNLPVYVWIFGGAWQYGYTQKYEGSFIAGQDVIVVTMNYRLGLFGFLASPVLLPHSSLNTTGMYGAQDIRASLQWVKNNIAKFGGDPNHVTLGGQSAGGGLSCLHVVAPRSAGLFTQWISESGFCQSVSTKASGYATAQKLFVSTGCNKTTNEETLACMLALPQEAILPYTAFINPTMDDYEGIFDTPYNMMYKGVPINAQRILLGNVLNETGAYTCPTKINMTAADYNNTLRSSYPSNWQTVYSYYPLSEYPTPVSAYIAIQSDTQYGTCAGKGVLDVLSSKYTRNVWGWQYEHYPVNNGVGLPESCVGSGHGFEMYELFPSYGQKWGAVPLTPLEQEFAQQLRTAWVSFIKNGVPVLPNGLVWPQYTFAAGLHAALDANNTRIEDHYKVRQCPVWGYTSPICTVGVALVARSGSSWYSNGQNNQIYDVKVSNSGNVAVSSLNLVITPGDQAFISQSWNLNQVSANVYALPNWYQGFALNGTSTDAGFVLTSPGTLAPSVSIDSISC